jgi:flagellar basal-body rod protein FlgC
MKSGDLKGAFDITSVSASGMQLARARIDAAAANLANKDTVGFKRRDVYQVAQMTPASEGDFSTNLGNAVLAKPVLQAVLEDQSKPVMQYQPDHPQANPEGYVELPNVNVVEEMTNMMTALRSYQANLTVRETALQMSSDAKKLLGLV